MNLTFLKSYLLIVLYITVGYLKASNDNGTTLDSLNQNYLNWQNLDLSDNKILGISIDKAYSELVSNLSVKKTVIVAVIDGGIDINHEDLVGKIWINEDEIPGNGIDDDHNGYIDDINGWNFLGNITGEDITYENYEYVRIINRYSRKFDSIDNVSQLSTAELDKYELYQKCKVLYHKELLDLIRNIDEIERLKHGMDSLIKLFEPYTNTLSPDFNQISTLKLSKKDLKKAKDKLLRLYKYGLSPASLKEYLDYLLEQQAFYLNVNLNARAIIGDNIDDVDDNFYGNNSVCGPSADHGTFVAGIIAANRNNGVGINGIADNVKIMTLRAVPDGDEEDKDIALSIRYAVDNGADIINMSFGKDFSTNKYMVDEAIKYAENKGVLLVHAAGNDANNNDTTSNYPEYKLLDGSEVGNWITVGASSKIANKQLPGMFSNYGKLSVELFAPGVDIISLYPNNKYQMASGTSFACPVVSGVAALVWSYYPELTVNELKQILEKSVLPYSKKVYVPNTKSNKKQKVKFTELCITGGIINAYKALELAGKKDFN